MNNLVLATKAADWYKLKALVLDSVSSPITRRVYNMALDEFMVWFRLEPRPGFSKATVSAWRASLEARKLGSSSIIIRMSAIRKLAGEAVDNGLLAPELAAGISRVKSVKSIGVRTGNWLSLRQAQALLGAPDAATMKGVRDRPHSATRRSVVHCRSGREARPRPHGSDAYVGEGCDRGVDIRRRPDEWPRISARYSRRPSPGRKHDREDGMANAEAVRRNGRSRWHRAPRSAPHLRQAVSGCRRGA
jgi:hypothetical protein